MRSCAAPEEKWTSLLSAVSFPMYSRRWDKLGLHAELVLPSADGVSPRACAAVHPHLSRAEPDCCGFKQLLALGMLLSLSVVAASRYPSRRCPEPLNLLSLSPSCGRARRVPRQGDRRSPLGLQRGWCAWCDIGGTLSHPSRLVIVKDAGRKFPASGRARPPFQ